MKKRIYSVLMTIIFSLTVYGVHTLAVLNAAKNAVFAAAEEIITPHYKTGGINFPKRSIPDGDGTPVKPSVPGDSGGSSGLANQIYVNPITGDNRNNGSSASPLRTLEFALNAVKNGRVNKNSDVTIYLSNGVHTVENTIALDNSYKLNGSNTLKVTAMPGANPVISGGKKVYGWKDVKVNGSTVWRAEMPDVETATAFYVNNQPRQQAFDDGNPAHVTPLTHADGMKEYFAAGYAFDWYSPFGPATSFDPRNAIGFTLKGADLRKVENPAQLELRISIEWKSFLHRGEFVSGKNNLVVNQDAMAIMTKFFYMNHISNINNMMYNIEAGRSEVFVLFNDVSFIKHPGDFCFSENERAMYYYPMPGETKTNTECYVPYLEEFIKVSGAYDSGYPANNNAHGRTPGAKFTNLTFEGVTFAHAANNFAYHKGGWTPNQAITYIGGFSTYLGEEYYQYMQFEPNILIENADNVNFFDCIFFGLNRDALFYREAVSNCKIERNIFKDIGGSAIILSRESLEYILHNAGTGIPDYHPGWQYSPNMMVENISIKNNYLRNIANWHYGQPAISLYYTRNCNISNNDIYGTSYMPINMGWGWHFYHDSRVAGGNVIDGNRIGNFNTRVRDSGGIYTLGQQQGAKIYYNYIFEQHEAYGGIYHDEGSCGYTTVFNVIENFNPNVPSNTWCYMNSLSPPLASYVSPDGKSYSGSATTRFNTINYNYFNNQRVVDRADNGTSTNIQLAYNAVGANGERNLNFYVAPVVNGSSVTTAWTNTKPSAWTITSITHTWQTPRPSWVPSSFDNPIAYKSALEIVNQAGIESAYKTALQSKYSGWFG